MDTTLKISLPAHRLAPNCSSLKEARQFGQDKSTYHTAVDVIETLAPQALEFASQTRDGAPMNYSDQPNTVVLLKAPMKGPNDDKTQPTDVEMVFQPDGTLRGFQSQSERQYVGLRVSGQQLVFTHQGTDRAGKMMKQEQAYVNPPVESLKGQVPEGGVRFDVTCRPKGVKNLSDARDFQYRADVIDQIRGLITILAPQAVALDGTQHDYNPQPNKIVARSCQLPDDHLPEWPRLRDNNGDKWDVDIEFDPTTGVITYFSAENPKDDMQAYQENREPVRPFVRYFGNGWYRDGAQRFITSDGKSTRDVLLTADNIQDTPREISSGALMRGMMPAFLKKNY
jgi:hypothetical protein